jgi:sulfide:quinone oxidoreductase
MEAPFNVVIAGAGVAGLEAALALSDLAGDAARTTIVAPEEEFVCRPMRVVEPFAYSSAPRYPIAPIAEDAGAELVNDSFKWLDPAARVVHTEAARELRYDALLLALGARLQPAFRYAVTLDDRLLDEQLHGLIRDLEEGYVRRIAFVIPSRMGWPLPIYELALMTARRAFDMNIEVDITVATPEDAPLALFGDRASEAVSRSLRRHGIEMVTSAHCAVPQPGQVVVHPRNSTLLADRIVALPELTGPSTPGVPKDAGAGLIPVDPYCRVRGLERVFAAGDATDFPVKFGGIAAQQADTAAASIAALAGAPVKPHKFTPVVQAILLGGERPLRLGARITGGHGSTSEAAELRGLEPIRKIETSYLVPYLESNARAEAIP